MNLIAHAVKFTEKGSVEVVAEAIDVDGDAAFIGFEVSDTGIGIALDKRHHIFEAFAQADGSTTRRYGGTGLGLSIAKQLCEMMGGSIEVDSAPEHGSVFRFTARFRCQGGNCCPPGSGAARLCPGGAGRSHGTPGAARRG